MTTIACSPSSVPACASTGCWRRRAGWCRATRAVNLYAGTGVAVRELVTNAGPADDVLFVNRQAVGVIEAKPKGTTLSGVEWQTVKYQANMPDALPAYLIDGRLPYGYESTGNETQFTCRMDPEPTARGTFWFHRPETLDGRSRTTSPTAAGRCGHAYRPCRSCRRPRPAA